MTAPNAIAPAPAQRDVVLEYLATSRKAALAEICPGGGTAGGIKGHCACIEQRRASLCCTVDTDTFNRLSDATVPATLELSLARTPIKGSHAMATVALQVGVVQCWWIVPLFDPEARQWLQGVLDGQQLSVSFHCSGTQRMATRALALQAQAAFAVPAFALRPMQQRIDRSALRLHALQLADRIRLGVHVSDQPRPEQVHLFLTASGVSSASILAPFRHQARAAGVSMTRHKRAQVPTHVALAA